MGLGDMVKGLPRRRASVDEVLVPADPTWTEPVLSKAACSKLRRKAYEASQVIDAEGEEVMASLLRVRQELASLRGCETWNHWVQTSSLFRNPESVQRFLERAWQELRPGLQREVQA